MKDLVTNSVVYQQIQRRTGGTCDYYIDSTKLIFEPEVITFAAKKILNLAYEHGVTHIGGEATSALPLVGAVMALSISQGTPLKGFMIRKERKPYGKSELIEGEFSVDSRVLLVDDVTGMGSAAKRCCELLINQNISIIGFVSIVDRQEAALKELRKFGIALIPLFNINEIMEEDYAK
ncbi:orotate phosphoribosyltransferase [Bacillus sp. 03113]|uniref:orotate phosphoribosyltransferase n=1 Tax=Bacillus sp. 03113 TaxID=2578211 RepID=UPI00215CD9C0|nr:phosphoribosyltransferase family protein [Bacillus sp. 03113]